MNIPKSALTELFQQIRKEGNYPLNLTDLFTTLEKCEYSDKFTYLKEIEKHVQSLGDKVDLQSILPVWTNDNNVYWGASIALCVGLFKSLISKEELSQEQHSINKNCTITKPTVIQGNLNLNGNLEMNFLDGHPIGLIVLGDLHIKGNYHTEGGCLVVLGDLVIDGAYDEKSDWSLTVIGGKCKAKNFINSCGELYVFDKISSPYIFVSYNHGRSAFNNGFSALYFHESDHGSSVCIGNYKAEFIAYDEIEGVEIVDELKNCQQLFSIFTPKTLGKLSKVNWTKYDEDRDGDPIMYLMDNYDFDLNDFSFDLLEKLRKGKEVFEMTVLEKWAAEHYK